MQNRDVQSRFVKYKLTNVININKIVSMHYFEFDKNFVFPGESHDFWEMVYVDSGSVNITAEQEKFVLKSGDIVFHKPNEFHAISSDKKTPSNVFVVSFATTSKNMAWFNGRRMPLPEKLRGHIKTLLKEGRKTFDNPMNIPDMSILSISETAPFGSLQIIQNTLEELFILLIRGEDKNSDTPQIFFDTESMNHHLVDSVTKILKENIYGTITIDEICARLNYSKTYISKIFSKNSKYTIIDYYTRLKINEAKKLMREKGMSFTEISNLLCFNNPNYFSRVFKRVENMTPREYMQSITK